MASKDDLLSYFDKANEQDVKEIITVALKKYYHKVVENKKKEKKHSIGILNRKGNFLYLDSAKLHGRIFHAAFFL
ncbi:MAG: hypothetical protein ABFC57_17775 [Veillonellales bacterium]